MNIIIRIILFICIFVLLVLQVSGIINFFFFDKHIWWVLDILLFLVVLIASFHLAEEAFRVVKEMTSIKKLMTVIVIIGIVIVGMIVVMPFLKEPPTPTVIVGKTKIPMNKVAYCWDGLVGEQCVSWFYDDLLAVAKAEKPIAVSPDEEIHIRFRLGRHAEKLEVEQWIDQSNLETINIDNNSFSAPKEKGTYVYYLSTHWEQGYGDYMFVIEVR